jgi:transcriptional regulator with XRE-family HTH domain
MNLSEILNSLIIWTDVNVTELADATGVSRATIYNIVNGKVKRVHNRTAERLARYFGITSAQLRGENTLPHKFQTRQVRLSIDNGLLAQVPLFIGEETARFLDEKYPEENHFKNRAIDDEYRQETLRIKYYLWLLSIKETEGVVVGNERC